MSECTVTWRGEGVFKWHFLLFLMGDGWIMCHKLCSAADAVVHGEQPCENTSFKTVFS